MKIGKICKAYIVIGIIFASFGLSEYKKYNPDLYEGLTLRQKVNVFTGIALQWPDPVIKGITRGWKHFKETQNKESSNESES